MAGLKQIKTNIRSIEKTQKVTKAMEAVSAAKMRKAQLRALGGRAYARAAVGILARLSGSPALARHPLVRARAADAAPALYLVITSDKGLAGALNGAVLRAVMADLAFRGLAPAGARVVAVGRKARDFFLARGFIVESFYPNTDEVTPAVIYELVHDAARRFASGEVGVVRIAYQNFHSTFEQRPTVRELFPLSLAELERVVVDIVPREGAFSAVESSSSAPDYLVEPSAEAVLEDLLPRLAAIFVYHALLESQASEHSARMVAMKSASDKAGERRGLLTRQFNRVRQATITREVSEITGGMEAMAA